MFKPFLKSIFDLCFSAVILVLASSIFLFTYFIFFIQNKVISFLPRLPGIHQQPCEINKFKTIIDVRNAE